MNKSPCWSGDGGQGEAERELARLFPAPGLRGACGEDTLPRPPGRGARRTPRDGSRTDSPAPAPRPLRVVGAAGRPRWGGRAAAGPLPGGAAVGVGGLCARSFLSSTSCGRSGRRSPWGAMFPFPWAGLPRAVPSLSLSARRVWDVRGLRPRGVRVLPTGTFWKRESVGLAFLIRRRVAAQTLLSFSPVILWVVLWFTL